LNPPQPDKKDIELNRRPLILQVLALLPLLLCIPLTVFATPQTRTSAFAYDAATGLLVKEIIEPDNSNSCLVTEYVYGLYGNKKTSTTRNCNGSAIGSSGNEAAAPTGDAVISSRTTTDTYDTVRYQFPTSSSNALNQTETKTYDPNTGNILSLTGPNNLTTSWQYDDLGRKVLETRADNSKTKWEYLYCAGFNGGTVNCPGIPGATDVVWLVRTTPLAADGSTVTGPISKTYYDSLDRPIRSETQGYDGNGASTAIYQDTQYDSLGRPYMVSRPYYTNQTPLWSTAHYDSVGRIYRQDLPDGTHNDTEYNGLTVIATNVQGQTRTETKNSQGQTLTVVDTQNHTINYAYDAFGNLVSTTDALGNTVTMSYDTRGRKTGMTDPDMGHWTYAYDALGQLVRQVDAKLQTSTIAYDKLGRMTARSEADLISHWYYDTGKNNATCNKGIGKLCQAETGNASGSIVDYSRTHAYDNLGRPISTSTTLDATYTVGVNYDANGRVATQSYPDGLTVKYNYTTLGYLKEVRNNSNNALYWQANTYDAQGHLLTQTYGNNIVATQVWNPATGRIDSIKAGTGDGVQNLTYQYDNLGNLTRRQDDNQNLIETFGYDSLNRLTTAQVNSTGAGILTTSYAYDAIGNITCKSDVSDCTGSSPNYTYNPSGTNSTRPHAVTRVNFTAGAYRSYQYDANGQLIAETQRDINNVVIASQGRTETYTSFNMLAHAARNGTTLDFLYGPEHQRTREVSSVNGSTWYLNPGNSGDLLYEKTQKPDNSTEQRNYITAGGQAIAVVKLTTTASGSTWSTRYLHRDNLGSTSAISDENGTVIERLAYEPFGQRRFISGAHDPNNSITPQTTDRGFTNHEHIDELALINMNGRIYDPVIGRFMGPDPFIQDPGSLQSYNRYSYVWNNPFAGTDPSGYSWFGNAWHNAFHTYWNSSRDQYVKPVVAAVIAYYTGYWASDAYMGGAVADAGGAMSISGAGYASASYTAAIVGGAAGGAAYGASLSAMGGGDGGDIVKAALYGGISGAAFGWAGNVGAGNAYGLEHFARHAVAGCVQGALIGGGCGKGALSGMAGLAGSRYGFIGAIVAGGTVAEIGGGKFANGAVTGAFGYLFNCRQHPGTCTPDENRADSEALREESDANALRDIDNAKNFARGLTGLNGKTGLSQSLKVVSDGTDYVTATALVVPILGEPVAAASAGVSLATGIASASFSNNPIQSFSPLAVGELATRVSSWFGAGWRFAYGLGLGTQKTVDYVVTP